MRRQIRRGVSINGNGGVIGCYVTVRLGGKLHTAEAFRPKWSRHAIALGERDYDAGVRAEVEESAVNRLFASIPRTLAEVEWNRQAHNLHAFRQLWETS